MIEKKYRTFWRRFCAGLIDALLFYPITLLNDFIWGYQSDIPPFTILLWYTIYSLTFSLYNILLHGRYGQTLGKMVMRVKVLDVTESPLLMFQAFRREIIPLCLFAIGFTLDAPKILSGVNIMDPNIFRFDMVFYFSMASTFGWFLAEMITMLFSRKRRALHDFIAGSVVIRLPQQSAALDHGLPAAPSER